MITLKQEDKTVGIEGEHTIKYINFFNLSRYTQKFISRKLISKSIILDPPYPDINYMVPELNRSILSTEIIGEEEKSDLVSGNHYELNSKLFNKVKRDNYNTDKEHWYLGCLYKVNTTLTIYVFVNCN